jgi:hypothetical protein
MVQWSSLAWKGLRDYGGDVRPVALDPSGADLVGSWCVPLLEGIVDGVVQWPGVGSCEQDEERYGDRSDQPWDA